MNKKGFTLIELMAVIILLSIIAVIATVSISDELDKNRQNLYDIQIDNIKRSAQTWASSNVFDLPSSDGEYIILTLGQLKESSFSEDVINPITNEPFSDSLQIRITKVENSYIYEVLE